MFPHALFLARNWFAFCQASAIWNGIQAPVRLMHRRLANTACFSQFVKNCKMSSEKNYVSAEFSIELFVSEAVSTKFTVGL